jgi:flagellin
MALGVLNNLSAIYAENNLNNTNNSLQTVLEQLSSGSKINSGADDAAGLSLVNGLEANQTALTQSETNATEGVGLLQVADGALSQVSSLLDRAITLATEASNGTLNSTQESAANQEYQSILAEVNNIGSTTTYNQDQVFDGVTVAIYTGDSSSAGSSIDNINIRALSSSSVGDTAGAMNYNNGANNVFLDLSSGGKNAAATDSLNASGATTITVNYITKGSGGSTINATANINVGSGTSYANTAQGMINAINGAGLGLIASFGTATQAGTGSVADAAAANVTGGGGTDTGIIISGAGVGAGSNSVGEVGALTVNAAIDTLGGTLNIAGSNGASHTITLGAVNSTDTLANLATTVNADNYGVTATLNSTGKILTFTSATTGMTVTGTTVTDAIHAASIVTTTPVVIAAAAGGSIGTFATTSATDLLSGTLTLNGVNGTDKTFTLGVAGSTDTIANLTNTVNAFNANGNATNFGITAVATAGSITFTAIASGASIPSEVAGTGSNVPSSSAAAATPTATTVTGTPTASGTANMTTLATITGAVGAAGAGVLTLGSNTITESNSETTAQLAAAINKGNYGVTATLNTAGTVATLTTANSAMTPVTSTATGGTIALTAVNTTASQYYSTGISGTVVDTSTTGGTANTGFDANANGSNGVATISYSDSVGANLSTTDLVNQLDAQVALTDLNSAITDASALDGYIGAQINTLESIGQVMGTQQENVVSAQNAIQATDYASATSNMSKYEILSQTGIAALAQANSVEQEVTKLLQ